MKSTRIQSALNGLTTLSLVCAGLGTLPVASADLPVFNVWPELRAYIMSVGFFGIVLRLVTSAIQTTFAPSPPTTDQIVREVVETMKLPISTDIVEGLGARAVTAAIEKKKNHK